MTTATITSKGQVTIPLSVRQSMRLGAGDRIDFVREQGGRYKLIPKSLSVKSLEGIVPRPSKPVSLEDMQKAIVEGATA